MRNYGLILDPIKPEDYVFGADNEIGGAVLKADGQWLDCLPPGEDQFNFGFEPSACASFGTLNAVEILLRNSQDVENYSDRFLAKVSGTTPQGNSPHTVAETLRKSGVCFQAQWDITPDLTSWDAFYTTPPQSVQTLALQFPVQFAFTHEYVPTSPNSLKDALKYSPLGVSVSAWDKGADGLYHSTFPNNHWCVLVGYVDGQYWLVYDSYDEAGDFVKKLAWDFNFAIAKRYAVIPQIKANSPTFIEFVIKLFRLAFRLPEPVIPPAAAPLPPAPLPEPMTKYLWDTDIHIRHSVRVICDEEGLTLEQKNTMFCTIWGESGFKLNAINLNKNPDGTVASTDYGICQWNDYYHGKEITPEEAMNNPEKAVRLMCAYWKRGQRDLWMAYKNGSYKQYL